MKQNMIMDFQNNNINNNCNIDLNPAFYNELQNYYNFYNNIKIYYINI